MIINGIFLTNLIGSLGFFFLLFVGLTGGLFSFQRLLGFSLFSGTKRRVFFNGEELFTVISKGASIILGGGLLGSVDGLAIISVIALSLAFVRVVVIVVVRSVFASLLGIVLLLQGREGFRVALILSAAFIKILGELRIVVSLKTHIIFSAIHISK